MSEALNDVIRVSWSLAGREAVSSFEFQVSSFELET